jgi:hypothetical protein
MLLRRKPTLTKIIQKAGFYFKHKEVDAFIERDLIEIDGYRATHSRERIENGVHLLRVSKTSYWVTVENRKVTHVTRVSRLGQ